MHYQLVLGGYYYQIIFGQFFRVHLDGMLTAATLRRLDEIFEVNVLRYIDHFESRPASSGLPHGSVLFMQPEELWLVSFRRQMLCNIVAVFG